jgi:hypothetical protein
MSEPAKKRRGRHQVCTCCGEEKSIDLFHKRGDGYRRDCKQCMNDKAKARREALPEEVRQARERDYKLRSQYGISLAEYDAWYKSQDGVCAICLKEEKTRENMCVDHNHETGEVRGLLCHKCNSAIGLLGDDVHVLLSATQYLLSRGQYGRREED